MSVTMLPGASSGITGFNPDSGSNSFVDSATGSSSSGDSSIDPSKDALSQLYDLSRDNPEYMDTYLQLLAERENTTNAQQWYERMSSTQYQRAMKDLEAAGVNPLLALTSLSGAGSGSVQPAGTWNTSPYSNKNASAKTALQAIALVFGFSGALLKAMSQ